MPKQLQYNSIHLMAHCSRLPQMSQYQKGKTNMDFIAARDSGSVAAV